MRGAFCGRLNLWNRTMGTLLAGTSEIDTSGSTPPHMVNTMATYSRYPYVLDYRYLLVVCREVPIWVRINSSIDPIFSIHKMHLQQNLGNAYNRELSPLSSGAKISPFGPILADLDHFCTKSGAFLGASFMRCQEMLSDYQCISPRNLD